MCAPLILSWSFTSTVWKGMNNLPRLPRIFIGNWAAGCYSCSWFYPALTQFWGAEYELRLILSCGQLEFWWLDTICGCLESRRLDSSYDCVEFQRLDTSYSWLQFRHLDTSCGWFYPAAKSSSSSWIRVTAVSRSGEWIQVTTDSILWLTLVLAAKYELPLIPSSGWL